MIRILRTQLILLIIILIGYIVTKKGNFSAKTRADLTNLIMYIIIPCNIFNSFQKGASVDVLKQCGIILAISLGLQVLYFVVSKLAYRHFTPDKRIIAYYATSCNNVNFMGLPIIMAIFGQKGLLYGSVAIIPIRIYMWTAGLSLFAVTDKRKAVKTILTHPSIWAIILGFAYMFTPVELPSFIISTSKALGDCTTVLTMLIIGSILSGAGIEGLFDKDCLYYSTLRLIIIPAAVYGVLAFLKLDPLVIGVSVISAAMPAGTFTALLAEKYGKSPLFASHMVFASTAFSMVTLPVTAFLLELAHVV